VRGFDARAACISEQYSSLTERDTAQHVDGNLTLGEDIADIGGLKLTVRSLAAHLGALKHEPPSSPETTPVTADGAAERRLFLSFAQMYCTVRDARGAAFAMRTDVHAPARARVNGALAQTPAFAAAYRCNRSSPMGARAQCGLW
jgi:predicted metalloendopeptidase